MPHEWLHLLQAEEGSKAELIWKLKHVYTTSDVFDMLEAHEALSGYALERQRIEKNQQNAMK